MALRAGPKSKNLRPLPPPAPAAEWLAEVTGEQPYAWQADVLGDLTRPDRRRVAYVQVGRKNGKTRLAASLALWEACNLPDRHIYAISDSERSLSSVLMREVRTLVERSPALRDSIHVFSRGLEVPETGSFVEAVPNKFASSQGINPHLVLFDEVHLQRSDDTWAGMQMAGAARLDALLLGITTPGYDLSGLAYRLYVAARDGDPAGDLYTRIYEPADLDCPTDDESAWAQANPCIDRPGFLEALRYDQRTMAEHEFRRFRLGLWTPAEDAWFDVALWDRLAAPRSVAPGERVWLGFDGSYSGDSTALVGVTADGHVFVVGVWENPGSIGWRVPRDQVDAAVHRAFQTWSVQELRCDPPYWQREIAEWAARYGRTKVLEFPTYSKARMAPACTTFEAGVREGRLTHDGDARLRRHLTNCVTRTGPEGTWITKADKDSPAKIDLAVAAVIAYQPVATRAGRRPRVL